MRRGLTPELFHHHPRAAKGLKTGLPVGYGGLLNREEITREQKNRFAA